MIIIPAIYPEHFEEIVDKLYLIGDLSKLVQINICDGSYGLRVSWLPSGKEVLPPNRLYEFDLILTEWREYLLKAYKLGVKRVVVHIDEFNEEDYKELFRLVHQYGLTLGVTVSNDVSIDVLVAAVHKIEDSQYLNDLSKVFVQVTGIRNVDEKKHPFDERVVSRIRILKNFFPALILQVGGQMNPATSRLVKDAGADRLVVGSYIFGHEDMNEAISNLRKALTEEFTPVLTPVVKEVVIKKQKVEEVKKVSETKVEKKKREKYEASEHDIVYDFDPYGELGKRE